MERDKASTGSGSKDSLDFEIKIGIGKRKQYPVTVIHSPAGEAHALMRFPFEDSALETHLTKIELAVERSTGSHRQVLSSDEAAVQEFGKKLLSALLTDEIRSCYDRSKDAARQKGVGLRLKLHIEAPELARLPWEFLYDPREGDYICLSRFTPFVRYIDVEQPIQPLIVTPPLQILAMVASPKDLQELEVEKEKQRVENALHNLQEQSQVNLTWMEGGTWRELQNYMLKGPWHIFHFIGHGGFNGKADEGTIAVEDDDGAAYYLSSNQLGRLLHDHGSLKLALLNCCEGARGSEKDLFSSMAGALVKRGLPAVLAMQYAISDRSAIEFSRVFYESVAGGQPVDISVSEARKAVSFAVANTFEWGTPVLFMRSPQGILFDLPETKAIPRVQKEPPHVEDRKPSSEAEQYFEDGLDAFYLDEWEKACGLFEKVLEIDPRHAKAAAKLEEARHLKYINSLYDQAQAALKAGMPDEAISSLEELAKKAPDFKDVNDLLGQARKQKQLMEWYEEARKLTSGKHWQAVINIFAKITALDPNFQDTDGLLANAEKEAAWLKRKEELNLAYDAALREIDTKHWQIALEWLQQIQDSEPNFRGTEKLIASTQAKLAAEKDFLWKKEQAAAFYEQAQADFRSSQWAGAAQKMQEIKNLDPHFADPDRILARSQAALAQEARLQSELDALYDQAQAAQDSGNLDEAIAILLRIKKQAPGYRDAAEQLTRAQKQKQLSDLYAVAKKHFAAGEWQAVINVFQKLSDFDPNYPDPEGLLLKAENELAARRRSEELEQLYNRAAREMAAKHWQDAEETLHRLQASEPGYRDIERLIPTVQAELSAETELKQRQKQISDLYGQALVHAQYAHWTEALQEIQEIKDLDPQFPDPDRIFTRAQAALAKLNQRQKELDELYQGALAARNTGDLDQALSILEDLHKQAPDFKNVSALLNQVRKQKQVSDLYNEAKKLDASGQWQEVVNVFSKISVLDPHFSDRMELLANAQNELARLKQNADLDRLYNRAVGELDAKHWQNAYDLLERIQNSQPNYRETAKLLASAQFGISTEKELRLKQEKIAALYQQARALFQSNQWQEAQQKVQEIKILDPQFADPEQIFNNSQAALAKKEADAQRQADANTMYAEAVKLLQSQHYPEALQKWKEVQALDPSYPDQENIQSTCSKKITAINKTAAPKRKQSKVNFGTVVLIVLILAGIEAVLSALSPKVSPAPTITPQAVYVFPTSTPHVAYTAPTFKPRAVDTAPTITPQANVDPFIFDDFNNSLFDGKYDATKWVLTDSQSSKFIAQKDGYLTISNSQNPKNYVELEPFLLFSSQQKVINFGALENGTSFFETRMKMEPNQYGSVLLELASTGKWFIGCGVGSYTDGVGQEVFCNQQNGSGEVKNVFHIRDIIAGSWHIIRIEVNSTTMTFNFYVDGSNTETYIPTSADRLNFINTNVHFYLFSGSSGYSKSSDEIGYFDDVQLGSTGN